ncbi:MAG: hypothetical protein V1758_11300 [Pseudomonadota bacterium]
MRSHVNRVEGPAGGRRTIAGHLGQDKGFLSGCVYRADGFVY